MRNLEQAGVASLLDKYLTYDQIPISTSDNFISPKGKLFVETRALTDERGLNWTMMIVIPEDDLLGSIKESRKNVIATSAGLVLIAPYSE
ncbi:hypothetical protein HDU86_008144 [Geranomyces michiganensis]|nr:hypothetical protein HDU86_008144 [Geranomyces michiganensis]